MDVEDLFLSTDALKAYGNKISGPQPGAERLRSSRAATNLDFPSGSGGALPQSGKFGISAQRLNLAGLNGDTYGINLAGQVSCRASR